MTKTYKLRCGIEVQVNPETKSGGVSSTLLEDFNDLDDNWNVVAHVLESLVLAHACAGIDVGSEEYQEGLETAIESCANNL
jgi:hypothetical protein